MAARYLGIAARTTGEDQAIAIDRASEIVANGGGTLIQPQAAPIKSVAPAVAAAVANAENVAKQLASVRARDATAAAAKRLGIQNVTADFIIKLDLLKLRRSAQVIATTLEDVASREPGAAGAAAAMREEAAAAAPVGATAASAH
jgi:hypothetical protein